MLNILKTGILMLLIGVTLNVVTASDADAQRIRDRYRARLPRVEANPGAKSKADYVKREDRIKFSCEGEFLSGDFANVDVLWNGNLLGSAAVVGGVFDLNMDTRDGFEVPVMDVGDTITVVDQATGAVLFEGTLRPKL